MNLNILVNKLENFDHNFVIKYITCDVFGPDARLSGYERKICVTI